MTKRVRIKYEDMILFCSACGRKIRSNEPYAGLLGYEPKDKNTRGRSVAFRKSYCMDCYNVIFGGVD